MESIFVGSSYIEDRRPESFQCGSVLQHQVDVIAEETDQAKCEHDSDDEQEQQVELAGVVAQLALE